MPMRTESSLLLALIVLAACAGEPGPATVTTRDSAGVTIVEHPAGAIEAAPRWTTGPATTTIRAIGNADETLTQVTGAKRLSDGRIVVVDFDNQAALPILFATDGTVDRRLGRAGLGPGEFQYAVMQGVLPGDTILFWDLGLRRLTRMLPSGEAVRTEAVATVGVRAAGEPKGGFADGRLLSVPYVFGDTTTGGTKFFRRPGPVILIDAARQRIDTIATDVLGDEMFVVTFAVGVGSETAPTNAPYGRSTQLIPAGDRVIVATNETADVASYSLPWQLRRITRFTQPRRPIDAAAREAYISERMAEIGRTRVQIPEQREWLANFVKATQFSDSMGYYSEATLAADSALWLAEMRPMSDSTPTYAVVGSDGVLQARTILPAGSRLLWAGKDEVLIVLRDEDDVPRVELRPIVRP
jgi:hypothetical protein